MEDMYDAVLAKAYRLAQSLTVNPRDTNCFVR